MSKYKKMKQLIADMRLPEYRYKQLLDAVFLQGIMRFEDMKLLPKTLREKLVEQFGETVVEIKAIHHEKSMQTDKVLFELSDRHAEQLTKLLFKHKKYLPLYHLDLIPYNQTTVTETMVPSSHTRIKAFCRIIHNAGISVNIRTQFGSDINAACGQLAGAYRDDQKQGERTMSARDVKSFGEEVEASC